MQAHKLKVTVPEDHQLEILLPDDFPPGPAEVIVLASPSGKSAVAGNRDLGLVLDELRSFQRTEEETRVLDDFEEFRRDHPVNLSSLPNEQ